MNSSSSFSSSVRSGRKQQPTDLQWSGVFSVCGYNLQASMKTSLTYSNPGRRFFGCHRYSACSKQPACNFFQWVDPPTCPRGHEILPTYIKKVKTMEEELRMQKKKEKHLKRCLVGSWMFNLAFLISAGFWVTWGVSA